MAPKPLPSPLPLFPLPNAVLFPKMPLPLHIFEERYRQMVRDVVDAHETIGMILLRPGWEADYQGRPAVYARGCAGTVERCEPLPDGRFDLVLRGGQRFRVIEEHAGKPYRLATVEPLVEEMGEASALVAARRRVLKAIGEASDGPALLVLQPEVSHDLFVNSLSQSMDLTPLERQSLLDCSAILQRYERLIEILDFKALERGRPAAERRRVH